ncbi:maleylpyruvate isomerase family mycothiol-dependent enzyme [Nonomuraea zeae]|uniref:Maleylpyruvate isomerase family mycothiol-dependent enzyme n=2 Tax=Nonomuraea zeae TaxID=1642303 RepID=A0A5S4H205_9ACTN|nr:maleylpyruvate isomerase family mycothiol-dependent enzyme [Nonomuraea zeae]
MAANRSRADGLRWTARGSELFFGALAALPDDRLDRPTALAGWSGKHLLAHVAANADALVNLAHWARTGEERPMYSSPAQREEDIEAGAKSPASELRAWAVRAAETLDARLAELDERQWRRNVRTAQGRTVTAEEIPWMRAREVMVHAVDLGAGVEFGDLPADFLAALIDDITAKRSAAAEPALTLTATDHGGTWAVISSGEPAQVTGSGDPAQGTGSGDPAQGTGSGEPAVVTGTLAGLAAYLSGRRSDGVTGARGEPAPRLPRWL